MPLGKRVRCRAPPLLHHIPFWGIAIALWGGEWKSCNPAPLGHSEQGEVCIVGIKISEKVMESQVPEKWKC